jgi:hypothetical protein
MQGLNMPSHLPSKRLSALRRHGPRRQRGIATLVVVMTLFFVISMVAAYASRNLIFEQRTSANQYRSTQAFEAAEAGIEWALAMLNGGRIGADCLPTVNPLLDSFRTRYLTADANGLYTPLPWDNAGVTESSRWPSCVRGAAGWNCDCPSNAAPVLAAPAGDGSFPAFRVRFEATPQPGLLRVVSTACTALDNNCLRFGIGKAGDAAAQVTALVGLAVSLPTSPAAPLTVRGNLNVGAFALQVANADVATNGITINAGGTVTAPNALLYTVPGSPGGSSYVDTDASLNTLSADRMFRTFLGVDRNTFKHQPSTVLLTCAAGGCASDLQAAVRDNPGRPIWVEGDLTIESDAVLGSVAEPVLLLAEGNITIATAGTHITGMLYSQAANWVIDGAGTVQGAAMAEGNLTGSSAPSFTYDADVVNRLRLTYGSMVRVPGGWKDF